MVHEPSVTLRGKVLGSENMGEGGQDSALRGDAPGFPEALGAQPSTGVWVPLGPLSPGPCPRQGQAFWSRCPGPRSAVPSWVWPGPHSYGVFQEASPCWGLYHRPPIPARAPRGLVSNGHSPWVHVLGPMAAGRSLGGPSPHQVHAHVEQLSPKAQESGGTPGRRPPPQGQPHPQLRAGSRGHRPASAPEGPRGPACGYSSHPSWVTCTHSNPLLPEVRGGLAQGGCEVRGSGHQGPLRLSLGGCQHRVLEEAETGSVCGLRARSDPWPGPQGRNGKASVTRGVRGASVRGPLASGVWGLRTRPWEGTGQTGRDVGAETRTLALQEGARGPPGPPSHTEGSPGAPGAERGSRGRGGSNGWLCGLLGPAVCRPYARDPVRGPLGSAASAGGHPQESVRLSHEERPEPAAGGGSCVGPPSAARRARGATLCLHCRERCLELLCEADGPRVVLTC